MQLFRNFEIVFYYENVGKSDAIDCKISIFVKEKNIWNQVLKPSASTNVAPGKIIHTSLNWLIPLEIPIPTNSDYKVLINYKDSNDQVHEDVSIVSWESARNHWTFGESNATLKD